MKKRIEAPRVKVRGFLERNTEPCRRAGRMYKAQTILEYSFLIALAAAALIAMRVYVLRSVQEKFRQSADVYGGGLQYAPGVTNIIPLSEDVEGISNSTIIPRQNCGFVRGEVARLTPAIDALYTSAREIEYGAVKGEGVRDTERRAMRLLAGAVSAGGGTTPINLLATKVAAEALQAQADRAVEQAEADALAKEELAAEKELQAETAVPALAAQLIEEAARLRREAQDLKLQALTSAELYTQDENKKVVAPPYVVASNMYMEVVNANSGSMAYESVKVLLESAQNLRNIAMQKLQQANEKYAERAKWLADYPHCF